MILGEGYKMLYEFIGLTLCLYSGVALALVLAAHGVRLVAWHLRGKP
jgi:hypothetical protein